MRTNVSLAHDQHSKVPLVDEGMTLTVAVSKDGIPFKEPPVPLPLVPKPPPPPSTPPWKPPPPSKDGSNPQPKGSSGS